MRHRPPRRLALPRPKRDVDRHPSARRAGDADAHDAEWSASLRHRDRARRRDGHARSRLGPGDAPGERGGAVVGWRIRRPVANARSGGNRAAAWRRSQGARRRIPACSRPARRRGARGRNTAAPGDDDTRASPVAVESRVVAVSYILDALKKAAEQRSSAPNEVRRLLSPAPVAPESVWRYVGVGAIAAGVLGVILAVWLWAGAARQGATAPATP